MTVGTEKRERQKANKARREEELARQAAKTRTTRLVVLIGGAIVAVFALVFIAGQFVGDDDEPNDTVVPESPLVDDAPTDDSAVGEDAEGVEDVGTSEVVAPPVAEP